MCHELIYIFSSGIFMDFWLCWFLKFKIAKRGPNSFLLFCSLRYLLAQNKMIFELLLHYFFSLFRALCSGRSLPI